MFHSHLYIHLKKKKIVAEQDEMWSSNLVYTVCLQFLITKKNKSKCLLQKSQNDGWLKIVILYFTKTST